MLKHLTIKNYALIRELAMDPSRQLNVITGETGAGKSILLGAIGLLSGNRADTRILWDEQHKCVIEGTFDISGYQLEEIFRSEDLDHDATTVIRREINPGGKSRAFINDTPVTLDVMKRIGNTLMDIHSQHETLQLGQHAFQLKLVDAYAGNGVLRDEFGIKWNALEYKRKVLDSLTSEAEALRQESDYVKFQLDELEKSRLQDGEQETLESELSIIENAGEIKSRLQQSIELISTSDFASRRTLSDARAHLQALANFSNRYEQLFQRLDSLIIELDDIEQELERFGESVDFDPQRAEFVKERLSTIYRLLKKHGINDIRSLLEKQGELQRKTDLVSNLDDALENARTEYESALSEATSAAKKLSLTRRKITTSLCTKVTSLLKDLGIPNATLHIDFSETELSSTGIDRVELLFSANKGIAARSLAQVASGGEFSRLMFSMKYVMADKTAMPTLVLDEIDNGVSGEVAIKLGSMMKRMSEGHQLIAISHLPQIAAKADAHYFVYKDHDGDKTVSDIKSLAGRDRIEAIARMIGGDNPSRVALENAQELLAL
jgi:DNA repair protein RecN (Recombination protein N)